MATIAARSRRVKGNKSRNRSARLSGDGRDLHLFEDGQPIGSYWLHQIPCDLEGKGWQVDKFPCDCKPGEPVTYHVMISADASHSTCECKGFLVHGHCKHIDSLTALMASGRIS